MAQLLAPYHNGMRLGQGFNSYTQQICLDNAVLMDNEENRRRVKPYYNADPDPAHSNSDPLKLPPENNADQQGHSTQSVYATTPADDEKATQQTPPWVKPQIVTYSSRFVDKLSDVTDSMNISGALSITTATVGGKGSGSYVDSDKFKESDLNFHLQVKVVNQIQKAEPYTLFNKIHSVQPSDFTAVYGDSFISGWEEGGELNAIVSMKVTDKAKIFEIKADLEAKVKTGALDVKAKAHFDMTKDSINKNTETTIAVNWSGGGSIKEPSEAWTIESMTNAAAQFPDLVAMTPQRTYAILTKYTALESFQRQIENYSILDYENASIYTGMLLDHYMEYKLMWKQLAQASFELERGTAKIGFSETTDDMAKLAFVKPLPDTQLNEKLKREHLPDTGADDIVYSTGKLVEALEQSHFLDFDQGKVSPPKSIQETKVSVAIQTVGGAKAVPYKDENNQAAIKIEFPPFKPTFAGLINARKICRVEMAKIVNEVDLITKTPKLALNTKRDEFFLDPLVYRQILPVVRTWTDDMLLDGTHVNAPVILGYSPVPEHSKDGPDVAKISPTNLKLNPQLDKSMRKVKRKSRDYRMCGIAGLNSTLSADSHMFNDLEKLDPTYRPTRLAVWAKDGCVRGLQIQYANGENSSYGFCDETIACNCLELDPNGSEIIFEVQVTTSAIDTTKPTETIITSFVAVTSLYRFVNSTDTATTILDKMPKQVGPDSPKEPQVMSIPASATPTSAPVIWSRPDEGAWGLRGFFGFTKDNNIVSLGVVWGKDRFVPRPEAPITMPLSKTFFGLSRLHWASVPQLRVSLGPAPPFMIGASIATTEPAATRFNHLDYIASNWKITNLSFYTKNKRLCGLGVKWNYGGPIMLGDVNTNATPWHVQVTTDLLKLKISKVKEKVGSDTKVAQRTRIQTVEFVRAAENGALPEWLLDTSTLRYLGDGNPEKLEVAEPALVESAPSSDGAQWSIRGFYGTFSANPEEIVSLGAIWGSG